MGEYVGLSKLMQQHASSTELKQHLINELKSGAFANRLDSSHSSQDIYLNDALIKELENTLASP